MISGHLGWVRCIDVDPSNDWFITGSTDRTIKIWDLATGTLRLSLTGHISTIRAVKVSQRHTYFFSAGEDKQVLCWDLELNKVALRIQFYWTRLGLGGLGLLGEEQTWVYLGFYAMIYH